MRHVQATAVDRGNRSLPKGVGENFFLIKLYALFSFVGEVIRVEGSYGRTWKKNAIGVQIFNKNYYFKKESYY